MTAASGAEQRFSLSRRSEGLLLAGILIVAAWLRLGQLPISEYFYDDAILMRLVHAMAEGQFQYFGIPASNTFLNFPASVYALLPPILLSPDLMAVLFYIALLNVAGVMLVWLIGRRMQGSIPALVAALLYAVNPWAIFYSRRIWAQDYHTPFILLGVLCGLIGFIDGKRWAQFLCLPLLIFGMQIHFAAWALLPIYLWFLWQGRQRLDYRVLALSLLAALLTFAPYIIGSVTGQTDQPTLLARGEETDAEPESGSRLQLTLQPVQRFLTLVSGTALDTWMDEVNPARMAAEVPSPQLAGAVVLLSFAVGIAALWLRHRRWALLILLWGLLPAVVLISGVYAGLPHYFVASIPAACLICGAGIAWAASRLPTLASGGLLAAFVLVVSVQYASYWNAVLTYFHQTDTGPTTPLSYLLPLREQVQDYEDVILFGSRDRFSEAGLWGPLLFRQVDCVRELAMAGGTDLVITPARPFAVIYGPEAQPNSLYVLGEPEVFPLRPDEGAYRLYRFDDGLRWSGAPITPVEPARFDSGATLDGYAYEDGRWTLAWRIDGRGQGTDQFFLHLLDGQGERVAQYDSSFYPASFWCPGDRLYVSFALDLPPNTAVMRVGMYRLVDGAASGYNAVDSAGQVQPWIDIPLPAEALR